MEAEFVNMFVQKQKDVMVDFLLKNVMAESKLALAEQKLTQMAERIQALEIVESQFTQISEEVKLLKQENLNLRKKNEK